MAKKQSQARSVKERAQDDLVMSTNSSSIVSKRSVERIYYPTEPHFFRFFVKKFQRRSPLINRGYHLRLHVIDVAVKNFLESPSTKHKVVINLGAGYDVLPWQCLTRYPAYCDGVKFIDVDFPDLMAKKHRIVQETEELNSLLTNVRVPDDPLVLLESDQYIQMGCDLRETSSIQQSLSELVDMANSEFFFLAEVSITYMETQAADGVIKWASSLGQAEFCLLEQILPDGPDHPFAETMLRHFEKLNTPIKSVAMYPTVQAQSSRFAQLGWSHIEVETLWTAWTSEKYLSLEDRRRLNEIEPFDEWEEFAIFGGHYCVVSARNTPARAQDGLWQASSQVAGSTRLPQLLKLEAAFKEGAKSCQRRFGVSMILENPQGLQFVANTFGLGNTSRLRSFDLYGSGPADLELKSIGPPSRMCHAVVDLGSHGNLLMGGRGSPSAPLKDCWVFDKMCKTWRKHHDLPTPLYRHAVTRVGQSSLALVIGGKTGPSTVFNGCLLYVPDQGWLECEILGQRHVPVFGAIMASTSLYASASVTFNGILIGGLLEDGTMAKQSLRWELSVLDLRRPSIRFTTIAIEEEGSKPRSSMLDRFGASSIMTTGGQLLVIGGIVDNHIIGSHSEILLVKISDEKLTIVSASGFDTRSGPRPLLLGTSAAQDASGQVLLVGGGATCFSMGTHWNKGLYTLKYGSATEPGSAHFADWSFRQTLELVDAPVRLRSSTLGNHTEKATVTNIPRITLNSSSNFSEVLKAGKPVIIEAANLGSCTKAWNPEHMVGRVGKDRKVVVHEAVTAKMDFNSKNFSYVTMEFGSFMEELQKGAKMYLRALSEDSPADKPAILSQDFPSLAEEFILPPDLSFVTANTFSSILRITGPVNMWLHYDVMANIYCQIVGSKRLILFPPPDVTELSFAPGASSSSLNVFAELGSASLANTHPYEAILEPGEVLYLPPLWLHAAAPVTDLGVAVNVFFRNLETGYAAGRDVYGNRDLAPYEKGRQDVTRIVNGFGKVPSDAREFYVRRLAEELLQRVHG